MIMNIEWDEGKNNRNILKHGIDFLDAALIFLDYNRIEVIDNRKDYGEIRYQVIGIVKSSILYVVYTIRKSNYRIISARRASKNEKDTYLQDRSTTTG
jgi:uncharacterized DUF497 family protein